MLKSKQAVVPKI